MKVSSSMSLCSCLNSKEGVCGDHDVDVRQISARSITASFSKFPWIGI